MRAVFDTNIVIDYLKGLREAAQEIERFDQRFISIITYIEVLVGIEDTETIDSVKSFLSTFDIVMVGQKIADMAIVTRQKYRLKIPDAIILATANSLSALLVTRNSKDFSQNISSIRIPYKLK